MAAEFVDRGHRKVGDGDENTRRLVDFLRRGLSRSERLEAENEMAEAVLTEEQRKGELLARFLMGEYGERDILELRQTKPKPESQIEGEGTDKGK